MSLLGKQTRDFFGIIIPAFLGSLLFFNITYTADFEAYENFYYFQDVSDFGFQTWINLIKFFNIDFVGFENITYFVILLLFSITFKCFKVNTLLGVTLVIVLSYVQIANQLRYFLAVPLVLLSIYCFCIKKNTNLSLLCAFLGFSFHSGVLAWLSFIPIWHIFQKYHIKSSSFHKIYFIIGIIGFLIFSTLNRIIVSIDDRYLLYSSDISSNLGSFYINIYPFICILFIYITYRKFLSFIHKEDIIIYAIALFTIVWIIISFSGLQIINARYINAFSSIWIIAMFRKPIINRISSWTLISFVLSAIFLKLILGIIISGFTDSEINSIILIWQSKTSIL